MLRSVRLLYLCIALLLLPQPAQAQGPQPSGRVRVVAQQLNVRVAPNPAATILGRLYQGALIDTLGLSADGAWYNFLYWGRSAWINTGFVEVVGAAPQGSSARLMQYSIDPSVPEPDRPFTIHLTLESAQDLAAFKVAASCRDFALLNIPRLAASVAQVFDLICPGDPTTGTHETSLILDTERAVSQGASISLSYWVDRPYDQVRVNWPAYSDLNVDGQAFDLSFDGVSIRGLNGARLWSLASPDLGTIHYDLLTPPAETREIMPPTGMVGFYTAAGARGALHVLSGNLDALSIEFRIYP